VRDLTYIQHRGEDNFAKFEHYRGIIESDVVLAGMDKVRMTPERVNLRRTTRELNVLYLILSSSSESRSARTFCRGKRWVSGTREIPSRGIIRGRPGIQPSHSRAYNSSPVRGTDSVYSPLHFRQLYLNGLRKIKRLKELRMEHKWNRAELEYAIAALAESLPINQSDGIFKHAIATNGSDEQINEWHGLADNWNMLGSYGQTELGHGSNVSSLETTATYDPKTQTFDLHSPTPTSAKFWPGGLGLTGTHSVIYAQMILPGNKKAGVVPFFVQLRDVNTGDLLPGVHAYDIGPKMSYAALDNGYAYFDHVTIPHSAFLARAATLSLEGEYTRNPKFDSRNHYATMLLTRIGMGMSYGMCMASGVTIASRYT